MIFNLLSYLSVLTMVYSFSAISNTKNNCDTVDLHIKDNKYTQSFETNNKKSILITKQVKSQMQRIVSK
jgi:hypothetical protein